MKNIIYILLLLFSFQSFAADNGEAILKAANEAYESGDYNSAILQYEQLLETTPKAADLHYNLGSAYFRSNKLGKAALHFEKAALLKPLDKNIRHNLKVLKTKLPDQFEVIPVFFVTRWWKNTQKIMSPAAWGILGLVLLWAGIGGLILWLKAKNRDTRKKGFFIGIVLILTSILPFALGFSACKHFKDSKRAVIMAVETKLRSAPDEVSEVVLTLHEGTSLVVLDEIGDWKKIRLVNGEEGWLPEKVLAAI